MKSRYIFALLALTILVLAQNENPYNGVVVKVTITTIARNGNRAINAIEEMDGQAQRRPRHFGFACNPKDESCSVPEVGGSYLISVPTVDTYVCDNYALRRTGASIPVCLIGVN
jgi:hypothetical protein